MKDSKRKDTKKDMHLNFLIHMVGGRMELVRFQGEDRGVWHTRHILVQGHIY